jgi:hypothetical protein
MQIASMTVPIYREPTLPAVNDYERSRGIVAELRHLLASKGLTVNKVSKETERLFGAHSSYFIPHNFCHNLDEKKTSPNVCQIFALSKITGYRMVDWFELFGFNLRQIPRLQMLLHTDHTTLLCSRIYDSEQQVRWPVFPVMANPFQWTAPVLSHLQIQGKLSAGRIESAKRKEFLYVKVGTDDAFAYPELLPGSIVRVDPSRSQLLSPNESPRRPLYLVEHIHGLTCCPVDLLDSSRILLRSLSLPYEQLELKLDSQARILGTVDGEIRRIRGVPAPNVASNGKVPSNESRGTLSHTGSLSGLLRTSRQTSNLHFREAHDLSLRVAEFFGNNNYAIAVGSLSDFEANEEAPRHIEKIISLCIIYGIDFWSFLKTAKVPVEDAGKAPMPKVRLEEERTAEMQENGKTTGEPVLSALVGRVEEIPLFLREGLAYLTDIPSLSPRTLYWWGRGEPVHHPLFANAVLFAVDESRAARRVASNGWANLDERPIYALRKRNGRYLCGFCTLQRQSLTVLPHPSAPAAPERLSLELDVEVVGRVIAVARLLA